MSYSFYPSLPNPMALPMTPTMTRAITRRPRPAAPARVRGFTLLEMIVVLVIIGLIMGLVGPRLFSQADTATSRFNLAWLLNPQNADAYRGLGIVASAQPTPDAAIGLLAKGLTLAPTSAPMMSDLGASYLIRYGQTKKKKDLTTGLDLLQRATAAEPTNATAWQQLARGLFYQEKYPEAWAAVHKGQALSVSSLDFGLISDLLAKLPDPQGMFK